MLTHEDIRAILLRPEAVRRVEAAVAEATHASVRDPKEAWRIFAAGLNAYADEAARTILQAQAGEQDERDAAVRALVAASREIRGRWEGALCVASTPCGACAACRFDAAVAAMAAFYPEGK